MSRSLNKATLIGNVGQDPEVRSTQNGGRVATFSLATSRSWTGPNGDRQEKTEWHRIIAWNAGKRQGEGLADIVEKYVKKGDKLFVDGPIEYRQWQDKDNQTRYTTEIRAREIIMLGGKNGESGDGRPARSERGNERSSDRAGAQNRREPAGASAAAGRNAPTPGEFDDFPAALQDEDDDLPF